VQKFFKEFFLLSQQPPKKTIKNATNLDAYFLLVVARKPNIVAMISILSADPLAHHAVS